MARKEKPYDDVPSVFIGCLAAYNDGIISGDWLDLDEYDSEELLQEGVSAVLKASPMPAAEEYDIQDTSGFCGFPIDRYGSLSVIHQIGQGIIKYGEAYAFFSSNYGQPGDYREFEENYFGLYQSLGDFGREHFKMKGGQIVPEADEMFFDFEAYARDKTMSEYWSERGKRGLHIFRNC